MRVLLLHPDDDLASIAPLKGRFDAAFDLSIGTPNSRSCWSESLRCPVNPLAKPKFTDLVSVGETFNRGLGHILDDRGLDWWDLVSIQFYEQMLEVLRLERFVNSCGPNDEIFVTRRGFHAQVLDCLVPGRVHALARATAGPFLSLQSTKRMLQLRPSQMIEILGDKYDGSYRLRRLVAKRKASLRTSTVLLPSAYGNASCVALGYARLLPDQSFLLTVTRRSGLVKELPRNVVSARLASYAPPVISKSEFQHLVSSWQRVLREFCQEPMISILTRVGCFDCVPLALNEGLYLRDAWLEVFASEPISAVLCSDEMNWRTRLPLLIARSKNIPAIACHHGALDIRYSFRKTSADRFLAKGKMEESYMVERCKVPSSQIDVGAPLRYQSSGHHMRDRDLIVFFSEPYENFGERCSEIYAEILPGLAELAGKNNCGLVVKLHPYESWRARNHLATAAVPYSLRTLLTVTDGPLQEGLIERAWFGVTITSTAALDCALHRVPVFLCKWLDSSNSMYCDQFIEFGVAKALSNRDAVSDIPSMLGDFRIAERCDFWHTISPHMLRNLFATRPITDCPNAGSSNAERIWA